MLGTLLALTLAIDPGIPEPEPVHGLEEKSPAAREPEGPKPRNAIVLGAGYWSGPTPSPLEHRGKALSGRVGYLRDHTDAGWPSRGGARGQVGDECRRAEVFRSQVWMPSLAAIARRRTTWGAGGAPSQTFQVRGSGTRPAV